MTTETFTRDEREAISRTLRVLEQFRELDSEMQMPQAVTLLSIALNEGISLRELTERTSQAMSSASRNVASLSAVTRHDKAGHGLVVNREDPIDRRQKQHHLTAKGRRFIERLIETVS